MSELDVLFANLQKNLKKYIEIVEKQMKQIKWYEASCVHECRIVLNQERQNADIVLTSKKYRWGYI